MKALAGITNLADELVRDKADIYHRIRLMNLKAQLLAVSTLYMPV